MVSWLWLIPAFAAGLALGGLIAIYAAMDMLLRAQDARDQTSWPPL